jgi:hypothetical protein
MTRMIVGSLLRNRHRSTPRARFTAVERTASPTDVVNPAIANWGSNTISSITPQVQVNPFTNASITNPHGLAFDNLGKCTAASSALSCRI